MTRPFRLKAPQPLEFDEQKALFQWAEVARIQALRADGSDRSKALRALVLPARPASMLVYGEKAEKGCPHPIQDKDVPELLPAFPRVSIETARRIISGESPVQISGGILTRKEAHAWMFGGGQGSPIQFLTKGLNLGGFVPRDESVARWLLHVQKRGAWSALTAVVRHPDGRQMRRLDVIDEITPADLDRGMSTGVERAFDNAANRLMRVDSSDHTTISRLPGWWPRLPRFASLLTTPAALAVEGRVMRHCVGGYADPVRRGQCWIVSIVSRHGRSTVELRDDGSVTQHKGVNNDNPPHRHQSLIRAWRNRFNYISRKAA